MCDEREKARDRMKELALVKWMGVGEVTSAKLLIHSSLHFRTKAIIPLCRTMSTLMSL